MNMYPLFGAYLIGRSVNQCYAVYTTHNVPTPMPVDLSNQSLRSYRLSHKGKRIYDQIALSKLYADVDFSNVVFVVQEANPDADLFSDDNIVVDDDTPEPVAETCNEDPDVVLKSYYVMNTASNKLEPGIYTFDDAVNLATSQSNSNIGVMFKVVKRRATAINIGVTTTSYR